jgi:predicted nucleic acid-binding protein
MPIVLDASTALSWIFQDERDALARSSASAVLEHGAHVPALWCWEIQNALLTAERRKRITSSSVATIARQLETLPIEIEPVGPTLTLGGELDIARRLELSVYDAAYVELALRRGLRLMTRDSKLSKVADSLKIRWKP